MTLGGTKAGRISVYRPGNLVSRTAVRCLIACARPFTNDRTLTEELATTSIYFASSMADLIGPAGASHAPIWRITPNAFYVPGESPKALIVRDFSSKVRACFAGLPEPEFRFLVDDDFNAGFRDRTQPLSYRARLLAASCDTADHLEQDVETIYVSHANIASVFPGFRTLAVAPSLVSPLPALSHHAPDARLRLLFPGTRSHLADLQSIAKDLARFLQDTPDAQLDLFLGRFCPPELQLPNVNIREPLSWDMYRNLYLSERFHIALIPCEPSQFNASRSFNKLLECAYFGAAPLFGEAVAFRDLASRAGHICSRTPGAWYEALSQLARDRASALALAERTAALAAEVGDRNTARAFWLSEFGLAKG